MAELLPPCLEFGQRPPLRALGEALGRVGEQRLRLHRRKHVLRVRSPIGRHVQITAWHEAFGTLTKAVEVKDGQTVTVDFVYTQKS